MIYDVLILGAGLAGLKAARDLQAAGRRVLVLDKSRGVGGRAATRRWDGVPVDHGAQFFTARSDEFKTQVADWLERGVCFEWTTGFHQYDEGKGLRGPDADKDHHPRYACRAGMNALGKDLAAGLSEGTVRLGALVTALSRTADGCWQAAIENTDDQPTARRVLVTLPAPQALALFEGGDDLAPEARVELKKIEVAPSLAVMLRGEEAKPEWQAIQLRDAVLTWIGVDSDKRPGRTPGELTMVLHGVSDFSSRWQDGDLNEAARLIVERAGEIVGEWITRLPERQVHRWRYASVPHGLKDRPFLQAGGGLIFAGDAFMDSKIEGAYRSGQAAARAVLTED